MRLVVTCLALVLIANLAAAQPLDGNIVLSLLAGSLNNGMTVYFDPLNPTALSTLATLQTPGLFHNALRMAPNNTDVVVVESGTSSANMVNFDPSGVATTIIKNVPGGMHGIELDGDDTWVCASDQIFLWGVGHSSGKLSTFVIRAPLPIFNECCIVREGGVKYAIANFGTSTVWPRIYSADRSGGGPTGTLVGGSTPQLIGLSGIELDPKTGDFITTDFSGPSSRWNGGLEVNRVSRQGKITSLVTFGVNGARVTQQNTVWLGGFQLTTPPPNTVGCMHFDLSTNTVITVVLLPNIPNGWPISQVEVYGSHPLTCNGQGGPGATISVDINSKNRFASGAAYQMACSMGRRPGLKMPNGDWLHLNTQDGLFLVTAQNLMPWIFRNFSGFLDTFGSAQAKIVLPRNFPPNLGATVFVAAVIFTPQSGVVQVTNTHWFEL